MKIIHPTPKSILVTGIKDIGAFTDSLRAHGTVLMIPDKKYIVRSPVGTIEADCEWGPDSFRATITKKPFLVPMATIWDQVLDQLAKADGKL